MTAMRVVVTGGAGFLGSHLVDALLRGGHEVVAVDNLCTGSLSNLTPAFPDPCFSFQEADISESLDVGGRVDAVAHLASPASPPDYLKLPLETLAVGSRGTQAALALAQEHKARFVLASTSEVYGDPAVHPQTEDYWGNVNPVGPRSVYDESKRFSEALTMAHRRACGLNTGIVRIFNTYGPRLRPQDGRVVSNFVVQALRGEPLTVYGDGLQTRSLCYVSDLVDALVAMISSPVTGPVNLGNPIELSVLQIAKLILRLTGSESPLVHASLPADDPTRRCPDITRARSELDWAPRVPVEEGLRRTITWFRGQLVSRASGATGQSLL